MFTSGLSSFLFWRRCKYLFSQSLSSCVYVCVCLFTRTAPAVCRFLLRLARFLVPLLTLELAAVPFIYAHVLCALCSHTQLHSSAISFPFLGSVSRLKLKRQDPPPPSLSLLAPNLGNSWGVRDDDLSPSARPPDRLRTCTHTHKHSLGRGDADTQCFGAYTHN